MRRLLAAVLGISLLAVAPFPDSRCPPATPTVPGSNDGVANPLLASIDFGQVGAMCAAQPDHPLCAGSPGRREVSAAELAAADLSLRRAFRYVDDSYQWNGWTSCGACADYALTMGKKLALMGQPGGGMALQLMFVPVGGRWYAHATLWVMTRDAGMLEVEVNAPPRRLNWAEGSRACYVALDGRRRFVPLPGHGVDPHDRSCGPL